MIKYLTTVKSFKKLVKLKKLAYIDVVVKDDTLKELINKSLSISIADKRIVALCLENFRATLNLISTFKTTTFIKNQ